MVKLLKLGVSHAFEVVSSALSAANGDFDRFRLLAARLLRSEMQRLRVLHRMGQGMQVRWYMSVMIGMECITKSETHLNAFCEVASSFLSLFSTGGVFVRVYCQRSQDLDCQHRVCSQREVQAWSHLDLSYHPGQDHRRSVAAHRELAVFANPPYRLWYADSQRRLHATAGETTSVTPSCWHTATRRPTLSCPLSLGICTSGGSFRFRVDLLDGLRSLGIILTLPASPSANPSGPRIMNLGRLGRASALKENGVNAFEVGIQELPPLSFTIFLHGGTNGPEQGRQVLDCGFVRITLEVQQLQHTLMHDA